MSQFQTPPSYIPGVEFSIPRQTQRPGIITTIGVMSIIVGSLTLLGSFVVGGYSFILFGVAKISSSAQASAPMSTPAAPGPTTTSAVNSVNGPGGDPAAENGAEGISQEASKTIADGVHAFHRLEKGRRAQFENFLQQAGAEGGFAANDDGTLPDAKKIILQDQTMAPVTTGTLPTDVLVTAYGRIEIYDEGVAFMPSDGSPAMRTAVGTIGTTPVSAGPNPAASGALNAAEIQSVISSLQSNSNNLLNPAQVATLTAALQKPGQTLVTPGTSSSQFSYAYNTPDGTVYVTLNGAQVSLDPAGKELSQTTTPAAFASPIMNMKVHMGSFATVMVESFLSGVLAIYLIVSGILVLRHSLIGAKLHWIYLALKIPLAITGAIALPWLWYSFFSSAQTGMPGGSPMQVNGFVIFGIIAGALAIAYPIGLIFALSSRAARGYYNSVVGAA